MDNASFHKGARTKELIEKTGCVLLYLPPYSPDFNPIENQWAVLKTSTELLNNEDMTIIKQLMLHSWFDINVNLL